MKLRLKFISFVVLIVSLLPLYVIANDVDTLSTVDHHNKVVIINDTLYKMTIGMQVYILDANTAAKRKVNRYALKAGQSVSVMTEVKNRQRYIKRIIISQY